MTLNDASDYIVLKVTEGGTGLSLLKLQKLVYYAQAWHLAFYKKPLFDGKFQAWVHGPVSRQLYARYAATKSLYSDMQASDISSGFDPEKLSLAERRHIDGVLEAYAKFSGGQLEEMTHNEAPWIEARKGYEPAQRCEVVIDENLMASYYGSRV